MTGVDVVDTAWALGNEALEEGSGMGDAGFGIGGRGFGGRGCQREEGA